MATADWSSEAFSVHAVAMVTVVKGGILGAWFSVWHHLMTSLDNFSLFWNKTQETEGFSQKKQTFDFWLFK